ncbi:DNA-binding protein [Streptomyces sp. NPDC056721]|uniref:MmyB family transcriptional regulator n=1 Tax=Streptomyces sp. NPDC056721 TaxID=3345923 RepID=UPI00367EAD6E
MVEGFAVASVLGILEEREVAARVRIEGLQEEVARLAEVATTAHDVRIRHDGVKRLRRPEVGELELTYQPLDLPLPNRAVHDLTLYAAEPGTASEDALRLLASWTVAQGAASPTPRPSSRDSSHK